MYGLLGFVPLFTTDPCSGGQEFYDSANLFTFAVVLRQWKLSCEYQLYKGITRQLYDILNVLKVTGFSIIYAQKEEKNQSQAR